MELTKRQQALLEFVKRMHGDQKRKYTFEPYWTHPLAVAEIVASYNEYMAIEAALCHDLFEDTECIPEKLMSTLVYSVGYLYIEAFRICSMVNELTDVYTPEAFPKLNRAERKFKEAARLGRISSASQSVKYADLIHNTASIFEHDKGFAKTYLKEKMVILSLMTEGEIDLLYRCTQQIQKFNELQE